MEVALLLAIVIVGPIIIVGGVQILIWKLIGARALRVTAALLVLTCGYFLVTEAFAPPIYGNKSGLVGLGTVAISILMVENLLILCAPSMRRIVAGETGIGTNRTADPTA